MAIHYKTSNKIKKRHRKNHTHIFTKEKSSTMLDLSISPPQHLTK